MAIVMTMFIFCGFTDVDTANAQDNTCDHTYTIVVVKPTCTERGYTSHYCTKCGFEYTDNFIQPLGHDMAEVIKEPTCTARGYTEHSCSRCDYTYKDNYVDANGHDYDIVITHPTCEEDGYSTYTCKVCGDSFVDDYVSAKGHDYEENVITATCTSYGYTEHICNDCGDRYVTDYVKPKGHKFESVVVKATESTTGYTKHTCTVCDYSYLSDYVDSGDDGYIKPPTTPKPTPEPEEPKPTVSPDEGNDDESTHEHEYIFNAEIDEENKKILTNYACECGKSGGSLKGLFKNSDGEVIEIIPDINGDIDYSELSGDYTVSIVDNSDMELTVFMLSIEDGHEHDFVLSHHIDKEKKTITLTYECECKEKGESLKAVFTNENDESSVLLPNEKGIVDYSKLKGKFDVAIVDENDFEIATFKIDTEETTEPTPTEPPTDSEDEKEGSSLAGILGILLLVLGIGGVVTYIIITKKNKNKQGE